MNRQVVKVFPNSQTGHYICCNSTFFLNTVQNFYRKICSVIFCLFARFVNVFVCYRRQNGISEFGARLLLHQDSHEGYEKGIARTSHGRLSRKQGPRTRKQKM